MPSDKSKYRILLVEDNPGDQVIVADLLAEQILDPQITTAASFKECIAVLSSAENRFDVILLDLTLPDKSGQPLLTEMLKIISLCPIIILTGYTNMEFSIRSISQGVYDYLLKDDLNAVTLYKSITYALERRKSIIALSLSEKRYSDLFHLSPQPMWIFDQDTLKFIEVNNATLSHYGYSEEEFLSMTLLDIKPKEEIAKAKEIINAQLTEDGLYKGQFIHKKKSGEIIEVEIYSTPIMVDHKKLQYTIANDVTQRNQYEHLLTKAIIKTQEDERYEIGGELHDNVCQILAASQMSLGLLKGSIEPAKLPLHDQCKEHISLALKEIRNLSHRLAPAFFDDSTLEEAFKRLFGDFNIEKGWNISLCFDKDINLRPISRDIQLNLYRILQEQLRNIQKYANATTIEVDALIYNDKLNMRVTDNGKGFDVSSAKTGIGLANMKRRAELFSGDFEITSSPGNGCTVVVNIPLTDIMND